MRICPLCEEEYNRSANRVPFVLPCCGNTICSACWNSLENGRKDCPFDRNQFKYENPVINRAVLNMIEEEREEDYSRGPKRDRQFVCEGDCENEAICYCKNCEADLCEECDENVHKTVKKHKRIPVEDKEFEIPICLAHKEEMKVFCESHNLLICTICVAVEHQKPCVIKTITEASLSKRELFRKKQEEVTESEKKILLQINQLNANLDQFKEGEPKRVNRKVLKIKSHKLKPSLYKTWRKKRKGSIQKLPNLTLI
jgi:hypothetical protein